MQINYYTNTGFKINKMIEKGLTLIFEENEAAEKFANSIRSYKYEAVKEVVNKKDAVYEKIYAVPK